VTNRADQGIKSLSTALSATANTTPPPPPPPDPIFLKSVLGDNIATPPDNDMGRAMENAALNMIEQRGKDVDDKFPLLNNWKAAVVAARPETVVVHPM
jgi:hypothetical protein